MKFFWESLNKRKDKHSGFTENNEMAPKFLTQSQTLSFPQKIGMLGLLR